MKKGVATVVASGQEPGALDVILDRSKSIGSSVAVAPALEEYGWGDFPPCLLGLKGEMQRRNASLALQGDYVFNVGVTSIILPWVEWK